MTMKAVQLKAFGEADQLFWGTAPKPQVTPDTVLVKVKATGINRADIQQRKGKYPAPPGASEILGLEVSGEIAEVGENSKNTWNVGDRVMALIEGGGYAEYALVNKGQVMKIPENYTFEEAAGVVEAFLAAYQALELLAKVSTKKGGSVLIHAGASGVGTSAIQICKHFGLSTIIVTVGSDDKAEFCKQLGATHAINYKTQSFKEKVLEITNNKGVSVLMDFIGGSYWNDNLKCVGLDGVMTVQGWLGGPTVESADLGPILAKRITIHGITLRSQTPEYKAKLMEDFSATAYPLFAAKTWKPIIAKVFNISDVVEAHKYVEASHNIGKVILKIE